jgi:hypothetical protein
LKDGETHRQISKRQRESYNKAKETLDNNTLLIEIDWKQKVKIVGSFILILNIWLFGYSSLPLKNLFDKIMSV